MYSVKIAFILQHTEPLTPLTAPLFKKLEFIQEKISHVVIPLRSIKGNKYVFSLGDVFRTLAKRFKKNQDISNTFTSIAGRFNDDQTIELTEEECEEIVNPEDCIN